MKYYTAADVNSNKPDGSKLTAIEFLPSKKIKKKITRLILCQCECGNKTKVFLSNFLTGTTKSCGCDLIPNSRNKKYFPYVKEIYTAYKNMLERCYNPTCERYVCYGAVGVTVCDEWKNDYQKFLDWSLVNGWRSGLQIDKDIKGNGKLYSPETCTWTTDKENMKHRKTTGRFAFNGSVLTIKEICKLKNIPPTLIRFRVYDLGMNIDDAVTAPILPNGNYSKKYKL